jgi:chemotaxis response regulator CheB
MPVQLAVAGEALQRGHVYVLPTELGVVAGDAGLRFGDGGDLFSQLPADDSALILLSGSDPAMVDMAMTHAAHGALVAGQSPDGCYDAVAAQALVARGAEAGAPAELARKLAARWPA